MTRRPRIVAPEADVDPDLPEGDVYDHPGLNAWRKSGDYAVLGDPSFAEWEWTVYRLHTPDEVTRLRPSSPRLWITRTTGPLDIFSVQANYGGGTFEFWGKYESELRARIKVDLAGPRKDFGAVAMVAAAAPTPVAPATDPAIMRLLEAQQRTLDQLSARVAAAPAPAAPPFSMRDAFELFDRMGSRPQQSEGQLGELVSAFREGISLRDQLGGAPERSNTDVILERVMPVIERVAVQVLSPRRPMPPPPPRTVAPHAVVVDQAPETEPPVTSVVAVAADDHRWRTAIEILANAIAAGDDPIDTADTIRSILQPMEVGMLRLANDEDATAKIRELAGGKFQVFDRPEAGVFIGAVLSELRNPTGADD